MHKVKISNLAREILAVEAAARINMVLASTAVPQADGSWLIELEDDVFGGLEHQYGPFDASEAIIKLCMRGES